MTAQAHSKKSCQHAPCYIQLQETVCKAGHADCFSLHSKDAKALEGEFHTLVVSEGLQQRKTPLNDFMAEVDVCSNLLKVEVNAWCLV